MPEEIVRPKPAWKMLGVGHTKFEEDFAPRLDKVYLGPKSVGYTMSSLQRLIAELVAESANAPAITPAPNKRRKVSR